MNFNKRFQQLDWQQSQFEIHSKTAADVERALASRHRTLQDFQTLISPAAEHYLAVMAEQSQQLTQQRFGHTIQMYLPLYLSNLCSNYCSYCGFSLDARIKRTTLNMNQLETELSAIKKLGFDHLLLVTGESERKVGMAYFREVLPRVKQQFSHITMEVQPLDQREYQELIELGLDAVLVYQETYHRGTYASLHLKGKKTDFDYRLDTPDRLGRAGIHKIGVGALLGLADWRADSWMVANHLDYLQRTYWQTQYSVSFPRLRPCETGFQPEHPISDKHLVQLLCAYRLVYPDLELSLSTRETAKMRDHLVQLGITSMSAGSSTQPGGYADNVEKALEQFEIDDDRHPTEVVKALNQIGYQAVFKNWDRAFAG